MTPTPPRLRALLTALVSLLSLCTLLPTATAAVAPVTLAAQQPTAPTSLEPVTLWLSSDAVDGEKVGAETRIGDEYAKVVGEPDTSHAGANWKVVLPAKPAGTTVDYQLFVRNQSGSDYNFSGFSWSYTVTEAPGDDNIHWNELGHNSFDPTHRSPAGAVPVGTSVRLQFRTQPLDATAVTVVTYRYEPVTHTTTRAEVPMTYLEDRVENGTTYAYWTANVSSDRPSILYYTFRVTDRGTTAWYSDVYSDGHDNLGQGGWGQAFGTEPQTSFQISVYAPDYQTPDWLANATVYQIFPDRYRNGDPTNDYCVAGSTTGCPTWFGSTQPKPHTSWNDQLGDPRVTGTEWTGTYGTQTYGGDLRGITQQLDHIKAIGFDTIYLTPIFQATSNHRYDTSDYFTIDPSLGTMADYDALVAGLHARGMHLILDGVFNHSSSDSVYFDRYHRWSSDGACESTASTYRGWYTWKNSTTPCDSSSYEGWWGYDTLAVYNDGSDGVRDLIFRAADSVVNTWYARGADGWRFDVADEISHDWWAQFRGYAKAANPDGPLVGEAWMDASAFLLGDQLDGVMNYRFRKNVLGFARGEYGWKDNDNNGSNEIVALTPSQFDHAMASVREDYPLQAQQTSFNLLGSHDTNRALYVLTEDGDSGLVEAKQRLTLAALLQYTWTGAPTVYYGDEVAIDAPSLANGTNGPEDDPYNRAPYPWADASGSTDVYGPADLSVESRYATLARIRAAHPALRTGTFATLLTGDTTASTSDNSTYAFSRTGSGESVVVAVNNGTVPNPATVPVTFGDGTVLVDEVTGTQYTVADAAVTLTLPARSGAILAPKAPDTTAPTVAVTLDSAANAAGWWTAPVTATVTGTDAEGVATVSYSTGGPTTTVEGATASTSVEAQGTTTVTATATDTSGNVSAPASVTVKLDSVAPSTSATVDTATAGKAVLTLTASDATSGVASTSYALDGGATQTYTGPVSITTVGSHTVTFWSTDAAGNRGPAATTSFTVAPASVPAVSVTPNVCVTLSGKKVVSASFGYTNSGASPVTIPVGTKNLFTPKPADRTQPTVFQPGSHPAVLTLSTGGKTVTWTLTGPDGISRSATASAGSPRC